ncbi:MAG: hypothetical protein FRX48_09317 [Lasallia pustulata]|uniref:Uncharacterized protein n=1 Tax=Lasallia pustulata TaxID=136370 RepID=A0A5M8PBZ3_9LECA|nr:MAG: hypothetical protein FRX48_09317 [Lasallia pustulata]
MHDSIIMRWYLGCDEGSIFPAKFTEVSLARTSTKPKSCTFYRWICITFSQMAYYLWLGSVCIATSSWSDFGTSTSNAESDWYGSYVTLLPAGAVELTRREATTDWNPGISRHADTRNSDDLENI